MTGAHPSRRIQKFPKEFFTTKYTRVLGDAQVHEGNKRKKKPRNQDKDKKEDDK
jgi:hypothetical protein